MREVIDEVVIALPVKSCYQQIPIRHRRLRTRWCQGEVWA
jgi:hypothetical protein